MLDYLVARDGFVCVRRLERAMKNRRGSYFGHTLEDTATVLPLLLKLVPHGV
jgi:hypothetical protein